MKMRTDGLCKKLEKKPPLDIQRRYIIGKGSKMENESVVLTVDLDVKEAQEGIDSINQLLTGISMTVAIVGASIVKALSATAKSINAVTAGIATATGQMQLLLQKVNNLVIAKSQLQANSWLEGLSATGDVCTVIQTLITLIDNLSAAQIKSKVACAADTVERAANAAAIWLQNAATTAWQAICTAATAVTTAFGAAMSFLTSPIGLVVLAITAVIAIVALLIANWDTVKETALSVWEKIKETFATVAQWVDENVLQPITGFFSTAMEWIGTKVQEGIDFVQSIFSGITTFLQGAFSKDWTEQFGAFGNVLNAFFANVQNIWNAIKSIFSGIVSFVKNVFAGDWGAAWDSIVNVFKGIWDYMLAIVKAPINGIIGLINGLVEGVVDGINLVIKALNNISFDIPDWVPLIGGETFGFNLMPLTAPKIPLLAKGAVLPANKPFLAMVGDQRHGTNIEAPLTTIQEAVAMVLSEQLPALMAGFEAVVAEQRATREMIGRIRIGDDVIANAAMRYNRKMAVVRGGW